MTPRHPVGDKGKQGVRGVPASPSDFEFNALLPAERAALVEQWTASRKTTHRLALMGFVREWSHYADFPGFNLFLSERGESLAQAIETRRAETEGFGAKHESAVGNADAPRPSLTHARGETK